MGIYTDSIEELLYDIRPDDDNYTDELLKMAQSFRDFDKALDEFIINQGYDGDINNIDNKINFIKLKFKEAHTKNPRDMKNWYSEHKRIEKNTAYQLCFAFHLNIDETKDFFRRVCLLRCFDLHNIDEIVYYYCMKHHLSYQDALDIIHQSPKDSNGKIDSHEVLYTSSIAEEIERINNIEELLNFFNSNIEQLSYNNATAYRNIKEIWNRIKDQDGLANRERQLNNQLFIEFKERSDWDIYLQILGFDKYHISNLGTDRSLKPILEDNQLLHPLAQASFPDRGGISKIMNGEHTSDERVRKVLILLVFYKFWVTMYLDKKHDKYQALGGDADRCMDEINRYLLESGYPTLYAGNPFDWIFMYALQDDYPLETFRLFMSRVYTSNEDKLMPHTFTNPK